jgi:hypothetical protein
MTPVKAKDPALAVGSEGALDGVTWRVLGFIEKCDPSDTWSWREYLLYDARRGYSWLVEYDGHWTHVREINGQPEAGEPHEITWNGEAYRLFQRGTAKVRAFAGEFPWEIKAGDRSRYADYVSPPFILSREQEGTELHWSQGRYVGRAELEKAFPGARLPATGLSVAPSQPLDHYPSPRRFYRSAAFMVFLLLAVQILIVAFAPAQEVFRQTFAVGSGPVRPETTGSFSLGDRQTNVEVELSGPVRNTWFEVEYDLVNEASGRADSAEQGIEFYSGTDSDGYWSEGSQTDAKIFSAVTGGVYHLNVRPVTTATATPISNFTLVVRRGIVVWWNFYAAVLAAALPFLLVFWRVRSFDRARWSESDYSPYPNEDDDD